MATTLILKGPKDSQADQTPAAYEIASANFALKLFHKIPAAPGDNIFFSPYSARAAFGMVYAGAHGETAREIESVLEYPVKSQELHQLLKSNAQAIERSAEAGNIELLIANSLWPQKNHPFLKSFLDLCKEYYRALPTPLDYTNPIAASQAINSWVEEKTRERIKDLVPPDALRSDTKMVLVNAIYFKAEWLTRFPKHRSGNQRFYPEPGVLELTEFMSLVSEFPYYENDDFQLLQLPYAGGKLALNILLPREGKSLYSISQTLNGENLHRWLSKLESKEIDTHIPKFRLETSMALARILQSLGLKETFDPDRADFSAMDGVKGSVFLSEVLQKTFLNIDEEGTEAAAATAMIMRAGAAAPRERPEPILFRAERPFVFFIRDSASGEILFFGRFSNPKK